MVDLWPTGSTGHHVRQESSAHSRAESAGVDVDGHLRYAAVCRGLSDWVSGGFQSGGSADDELDGHDNPGRFVAVHALLQVPGELVGVALPRDPYGGQLGAGRDRCVVVAGNSDVIGY